MNFDVHVTVHRAKFSMKKPNRCTNFSNLFLEWNSTCFGQFLCPSSGVFHVHTTMVYVIQVCWQLASSIRIEVPSWSCKHVSKLVWHITSWRVQWKTPDDGQKNCPKHVEFHFKNKFEKSVHLVSFIIGNLVDELQVGDNLKYLSKK